jgi:hypothetical protein
VVAGVGEAEALARRGPAALETEVVEAMACREVGAAAVRALPQEEGAQADRARVEAESQEHPEAKAGRARAEAERLESEKAESSAEASAEESDPEEAAEAEATTWSKRERRGAWSSRCRERTRWRRR